MALPTHGLADSLDDLVRDYRAYGLPEPPKDAPLVQFPFGSSAGEDAKETPHLYLGFLLQPDDKRRPAVVLVGTLKYQLRKTDGGIVKVDPNAASLENVCGEWMSSAFGINVGLATALQCKTRGWDKLAQRLWDLSIRQSSGHERSPWHLPPNQPPKEAVATTAWVHYMNQLMEPDTDRRVIEGRMKLLISREPTLDNEANRKLLSCLKATFVPSRAKPGTPEALIDALVEMRGQISLVWEIADDDGAWHFLELPDRLDSPPRWWVAWRHLIELGFDAMPALIDHLDDVRLTRTYDAGFNDFPPHPILVGNVVASIVKGLAGDEIERDWRRQGASAAKSKAQDWFAAARKASEEEYLVRHVLPERAVAPRVDVTLNKHILLVLAKKYPTRLPELYRRLLRKRPQVASDSLAKAIAAGPLTKAQKTELFRLAAETPDLKQRATALRQLKDLDHERFVIDLVKSLDDIKQSPAKVSPGCPEWAFAALVDSTSDARAWQALRGAAERVDAQARIEILDRVGTAKGKSTALQETRRLEFLASFLKDETVRTLTGKVTGSEDDDFFLASSDFLRLEVRDFAALQLAAILGIKDSPNKDSTTQDRARFRTKIHERLSREKIDPDSPPNK